MSSFKGYSCLNRNDDGRYRYDSSIICFPIVLLYAYYVDYYY